MNKLDKEWEFITAKIHDKNGTTNLIRREILFAMQILLSMKEMKKYFVLKKIYAGERT